MRLMERRYTKEQVAAVIRECLDGPVRRSVPSVLREAAIQGLPDANGDRLPAFTANEKTLRRYVADELRKRRRTEVIEAGAGDAATALADRLAVVGDREVRRLENRSLQGKATAAEVRDVTNMVRDLARLSREAGKRNGTSAAPAPDEPATADTPASAEDEIAVALPQAPKPLV